MELSLLKLAIFIQHEDPLKLVGVKIICTFFAE